jgi:hypothetical protein
MVSLGAHQAAADYPMIVSPLSLRLHLSNVRSIQCAHCVPPSTIHAQPYGDICIPQALLCTICVWFPTNSLLLKKRNELERQSNYNKCFNPPNIAPGGIFWQGMSSGSVPLEATITGGFLMEKWCRLDQDER